MRKFKIIMFAIYLIFGAYFINLAVGLYTIPESISTYTQVINLIGGILIIFGGISSFRLWKHRRLPAPYDFS